MTKSESINDSIVNIEIAYCSQNKFLFDNRLNAYYYQHGEKFADLFVLKAKDRLRHKRYTEAYNFCDLALEIIDHPWAIYYKILAAIGQNSRIPNYHHQEKIIKLATEGAVSSTKVLDETKFQAFWRILEEFPHKVSADNIPKLLEAGGTNYQDTRLSQWDLEELRESISSDLITLKNSMYPRDNSLSKQSVLLLYENYFYICKYLQLNIVEHDICELNHLFNFNHVYNLIANCIHYPTSTAITKKNIIEIQQKLLAPQFWNLNESQSEHLISPELRKWLDSHEDIIEQYTNQEGAFVIDQNGTSTFEPKSTLINKYRKYLGNCVVPEKIVMFFHFWMGPEIVTI